jgi:hypothetical protein
MKLLEQNQLIGTSAGNAVFRDLYETEDGKRVSIPTSREFCMMQQRTLPNGRLLPSYDVSAIFEKYRLN